MVVPFVKFANSRALSLSVTFQPAVKLCSLAPFVGLIILCKAINVKLLVTETRCGFCEE